MAGEVTIDRPDARSAAMADSIQLQNWSKRAKTAYKSPEEL